MFCVMFCEIISLSEILVVGIEHLFPNKFIGVTIAFEFSANLCSEVIRLWLEFVDEIGADTIGPNRSSSSP